VVLREILRWTNGQPFLTQKICALVMQASESSIQGKLLLPPGTEGYWIDQLVQTHLIQDWEVKDNPEHLRTLRDRLIQSPRSIYLLKLYGSILNEKKLFERASMKDYFLEKQQFLGDLSSLTLELILTGLVERHNNYLVIKNRLYQEIFSAEWLRQQQDLIQVMMIRNPEGDRRQKYLTFRKTDLQETTNPIAFPSTKAALQRISGRVIALLVGIATGIAIGLLLSRILRR
jgi:hypothetical protein